MKYWFEVEDAQRWGLPAAAVLAHLKYWIARNTERRGGAVHDAKHERVWQGHLAVS